MDRTGVAEALFLCDRLGAGEDIFAGLLMLMVLLVIPADYWG